MDDDQSVTEEGFYRMVVEAIAHHPGSTTADIGSQLDVPDGDIQSTVADAIDRGDIVEFDGKLWVVRTGRYAFGEFDHPIGSDS